jgi:cytochrome c-type biogenesis protein CcmH/NrfF
MSRRILPLVLVLIAVGAAVAGLIAARGPDPDATPTSGQVQRRVMSPFCPGVLLVDCQTRQSAELIGRIEDRIDRGWTNREIDEWLSDNYGPDVLATPSGALPWLIPAAILIGGAGVVVFVGSRRDRDLPKAPPAVRSDYRERIDAELKSFAGSETE